MPFVSRSVSSRRLRRAGNDVSAAASPALAGTGFTVALAQRPNTDPLPALHVLLDLPNRLRGHKDHRRMLLVLDEFQSLRRV